MSGEEGESERAPSHPCQRRRRWAFPPSPLPFPPAPPRSARGLRPMRQGGRRTPRLPRVHDGARATGTRGRGDGGGVVRRLALSGSQWPRRPPTENVHVTRTGVAGDFAGSRDVYIGAGGYHPGEPRAPLHPPVRYSCLSVGKAGGPAECHRHGEEACGGGGVEGASHRRRLGGWPAFLSRQVRRRYQRRSPPLRRCEGSRARSPSSPRRLAGQCTARPYGPRSGPPGFVTWCGPHGRRPVSHPRAPT